MLKATREGPFLSFQSTKLTLRNMISGLYLAVDPTPAASLCNNGSDDSHRKLIDYRLAHETYPDCRPLRPTSSIHLFEP